MLNHATFQTCYWLQSNCKHLRHYANFASFFPGSSTKSLELLNSKVFKKAFSRCPEQDLYNTCHLSIQSCNCKDSVLQQFDESSFHGNKHWLKGNRCLSSKQPSYLQGYIPSYFRGSVLRLSRGQSSTF